MSYRLEPVAAGMGAVSVSQPAALDRSAWWPVIEKEQWCHRAAMTLLEHLERGLFDPLGTEPEDEDDGDA